MIERDGVRWRYLGEGFDPVRYPDAKTCGDCGRAFQASANYNDGAQNYCPECHPVESMGVSIRKALDRVDTEQRPEMVRVGEKR